jgi:hypothetical protein
MKIKWAIITIALMGILFNAGLMLVSCDYHEMPSGIVELPKAPDYVWVIGSLKDVDYSVGKYPIMTLSYSENFAQGFPVARGDATALDRGYRYTLKLLICHDDENLVYYQIVELYIMPPLAGAMK